MIHSAPQKKAATLRKVLAPFSVSHVIAIDSCSLLSRSFSLFSLFLVFTAISDCVFNNKNNYSTRACWISNNYNHFGATIISSAPSFYANLRVPTRVYDVKGGAIFSKKQHICLFRWSRVDPALTVSFPTRYVTVWRVDLPIRERKICVMCTAPCKGFLVTQTL